MRPTQAHRATCPTNRNQDKVGYLYKTASFQTAYTQKTFRRTCFVCNDGEMFFLQKAAFGIRQVVIRITPRPEEISILCFYQY